jgi:purine-binding chemotaxis protein CheW
MPVLTESAKTDKHLTFMLASETYGLEILRVAEIVGLMPVTRVPRLPRFVAGVINLRGRVIPVVDLRLAFGLPTAELGERTCIVIAQIVREGVMQTVGLIVDEVSEVLDMPVDAIEATPDFGTSVDTSFVKGVGRVADRVILLLDIDRALSGSQYAAVEQAAVLAEHGEEGTAGAE